MSKLYEIDEHNEILLNLGENIDALFPKDVDIMEALKQGKIDYYSQLQEEKKAIKVRFSGLRRGTNGKKDELFVLFENLELIYPLEKVPFTKRIEATELLDKEYVVYVRRVDKEKNLVYLSDERYEKRKDVIDDIGKKLESGEEIYLRGRIIGLQKDGGKNGSMMACYVDIAGLGILGVIPIRQWSVGFSATESFRQVVRENVGAVVNFRVKSRTTVRTGSRSRQAFVCSRLDYLEKIGYNPWESAKKILLQGATVKVRIVEEGRSSGSFFGAIDGIFDLNMLCYCDSASDLKISDINIDSYYYGYVQKVDFDKHYLRVRLTKKAEYGSDIKKA